MILVPGLALAFALAFVLAWSLTGAVRRYALKRDILDVPNHRSSHEVPTPRGGGLAIAGVCLAGTAALAASGVLEAGAALALLAGGSLVAGAGWLDDRGDLPAAWRLLAHTAAAALAVHALGGLDSLTVGTWQLSLGPAGFLLAIVGLVWLTNLFNFMDGIDGLAAGEAAMVAGAGGILLLAAGETGPGAASLMVAAAAAGFLVWNWAPARIFMGDAGSGFLGFTLGTLALVGEATGAAPLTLWVLMLGVFGFDATVTLVRRILRRERWSRPHRKHAYQRATQAGLGHDRVTGAVLLINLALVAFAAAAWVDPRLTVPAMAAGIALLVACHAVVERNNPMTPAPRGGGARDPGPTPADRPGPPPPLSRRPRRRSKSPPRAP